MSRRRLCIRKFLNLTGHHAGAYVFIEVYSGEVDGEIETRVTFKITDCFDGISLDFDMMTAADRRNSLHKARVLRDAVTRLEAALDAELRLHERTQRRAS